MNRNFVRFGFLTAFLVALLVACEQTPMGATLDIDVDPDDARITVMREIDGALIHEGFGDVTLRSLLPGIYVVTTGEGDDLVVRYVTVGVRDRERFTLEIMASKGPGGGGGGGGSGGGGGGKGDSYSELLLLHRDVHGVPITVEYETSYCVQPITTEPVPNPYYLLNGDSPESLLPIVNPVDGRTVTLVPLFAHYPEFLPVEVAAAPDVGTAARPIDPGPPDDHEEEDGSEPCDPLVITLEDGTIYSYAAFAKEVELERLNLARAPKHVLLQHMREVEALILATATDLFTLDVAGRPTFDGVTIDAMPKLQGMREALLETGTLPGADAYPFPFRLRNEGFELWTPWELSSFALGGAASKFGTLNVDAVAYHDRVMGIAVDMVAAAGWPRTPWYSTELKEYFVNYSGFTYDRETTFPGCVVYLDPADVPAGYQAERLLDVVAFSAKTPKQNDLAGYAQMAEDARAVIYFIHLYDAVVAYVDPVGLDSWDACVALATELNPPAE